MVLAVTENCREIAVLGKQSNIWKGNGEAESPQSIGKWIDMPPGEQPLKKKTTRHRLTSRWCGNSLKYLHLIPTFNTH